MCFQNMFACNLFQAVETRALCSYVDYDVYEQVPPTSFTQVCISICLEGLDHKFLPAGRLFVFFMLVIIALVAQTV